MSIAVLAREEPRTPKTGVRATPSPVPPRLEKTPVAGHPLPQKGEGWKFKSVRRSVATLVKNLGGAALHFCHLPFALCLLHFAFCLAFAVPPHSKFGLWWYAHMEPAIPNGSSGDT